MVDEQNKELGICETCKWFDCTQAQCFDGHLQFKKECESYVCDTSVPKHEDIEIKCMKLYALMVKARYTGVTIRFRDGTGFTVKIKSTSDGSCLVPRRMNCQSSYLIPSRNLQECVRLK